MDKVKFSVSKTDNGYLLACIDEPEKWVTELAFATVGLHFALTMYTENQWMEILSKIRNMPLSKRAKTRPIFGLSIKITWEDGNKFWVSELLGDHIKLGSAAYIERLKSGEVILYDADHDYSEEW